jgi:hypothetical protein
MSGCPSGKDSKMVEYAKQILNGADGSPRLSEEQLRIMLHSPVDVSGLFSFWFVLSSIDILRNRLYSSLKSGMEDCILSKSQEELHAAIPHLVRVVIIAFKMAFTLICKFFVSKHSF